MRYVFVSMLEGINDLGVEDLDNFVDYSGFCS